MFERFTERARRVMGLSRQEAQRLGSEFIGTEHLLIGLVEESEGIAARVIGNLGLRLGDVRGKVLEALRPPGPVAAADWEPTSSVRTRTVIQEAAGEARMMRSPAVEPEHLLLAILAEKGPASGLWTHSGITAEAIRGILPRNPE